MWHPPDESRPWPSIDPASAVGTVLTGPFATLPTPGQPGHAANDDDHRTPVEPLPSAAKAGLQTIFRRLGDLPRRILAGIVAWRQRQVLKESLLAMDRHQLADIGLTPEDIPAVVEGRFRQRRGGRA